MKSKLCLIPFIPLTVAAAAVMVMQKFSIVFTQDTTLPSYIAVGLVLLMFAVNIVFTALDKETSPMYLLNRNIPSAVFSVLSPSDTLPYFHKTT